MTANDYIIYLDGYLEAVTDIENTKMSIHKAMGLHSRANCLFRTPCFSCYIVRNQGKWKIATFMLPDNLEY